ncbi:MAG: aminopeptidase [Armatimonadetes bacterium]|nr:aminopeptidase [Armatimonadota bacterium]
MNDSWIAKKAALLAGYSLRLRPGDLLVLESTPAAGPLVRQVYREALRAGAHVRLKIGLEELEEIFYKHASDEQLTFVSDLDRAEVERMDASLRIVAPLNPKALTGVDPSRQVGYFRAHGPLREIFFGRSGRGELRWCLTRHPTHADAQEAEMSLGEFEEFVARAEFLDQVDPLAAWETLSARQRAQCEFLEGVRALEVRAPDTDLRMGVAGRRWFNSDGRRNFPSGEVFTGPVEDSVEGHIRFTFPALYRGREVTDVRLTFEKGRVVNAEAAHGREFLEAMLGTDAGARYVGEFAFGNNEAITRFSKIILFDEKIGGTVHLALGSSYPETGGKNRSAIHWDMICDLRQGGEVRADGQVIHRDGRWVI